MSRTLVVVCALAVVLGGCAGGDDPAKPTRTFEPQNTASSPSPQVKDEDPLACTLLTSKERRSIAGQKLDVVAPSRVRPDIHQCRWVDSLAAPLPNSVAVVTQTVQVWLQNVPKRIDAVIKSGDASGKLLEKLEDAKKRVLRRERISDADACDIFSLLIEVRFDKEDLSQYFVQQDANSASVTRCANGVHTAVSYSERGLQASFALSEALQRLTKLAHKRAVKRLL